MIESTTFCMMEKIILTRKSGVNISERMCRRPLCDLNYVLAAFFVLMMEVDVDHRVELVLASAGRHIFREKFFTLPYWRTVLELGWGKLSSFNLMLGSVKSVIPLPLPPPKPKPKGNSSHLQRIRTQGTRRVFSALREGF